jgi:hypothetical protein
MKITNKTYLKIFAIIILIIVISLIIWFVIKENNKKEDKPPPSKVNLPTNELIEDDRIEKNSEFLPHTYIAMNPEAKCLAILNGFKVSVKKIENDFSLTSIGQEYDSNFENGGQLEFQPQIIEISNDCTRLLISNYSEFMTLFFDGTSWVVEQVDISEKRENGGVVLSPDGLYYCGNSDEGGVFSDPPAIKCTDFLDLTFYRNTIILTGEDPNTTIESKLALNLDNSRLAYTSIPTSQVFVYSSDPSNVSSWSESFVKLDGTSPREIAFSPDGNYLGVLWNDEVAVYDVKVTDVATKIFTKSNVGSGLSNISMSNKFIAFNNNNSETYQQEFKDRKNYIKYKGRGQSLLSANDAIYVRGLNNNISIFGK